MYKLCWGWKYCSSLLFVSTQLLWDPASVAVEPIAAFMICNLQPVWCKKVDIISPQVEAVSTSVEMFAVHDNDTHTSTIN